MTPKTTSTFRTRKGQAWQKKAFLFSKIIPELNYASRFYAKMLTRLRIYPAFRNPSDETTPITEGPPVDLLDRIQDPGGGRSGLLSSYGRLMFIIGEGYLFGRDLDKPTERWAFVNTEEISFDGKAILWTPTSSAEPIRFSPSQAEAYRMWNPDPEFSGEAESPMRAIIEIAQELDILTKAVASTAVSRMVNGILKVPAELSFGSEEPGIDEDPEANPFLADWIEHIIGIIENAGSPEAGAPFLAEGALEYLAGLEWMKTHDPATDYMEQAMRREAIDRAAMGMDLPPEILKGMAEANHWGARQIMHDTWRSHGAVVAEQFCDDLADAYLRPALRDAGFDRWREVVVAYDDSNVVVPPDRTDDADKAHDRGQVNDPGYRTMKGIPESMAPSEEEMRINLAIQLHEPALLKGTRFEIEEPEPAALPPGPVPTTDAPQDAEEGPPAPGPAGTSRQESRASIVQVNGAASLALIRCREVAGAKIRQGIRTKSRGAVELGMIDGIPNADVACTLGEDRIRALGLPQPLELVKSGTDGFCSLLRSWDFDDPGARVLAEMLLVFAAKSLYDKEVPKLPAGFLAQVERLKELTEEKIVSQNNDSLAIMEEMLGGVRIKGG
jgi:hypothetical protein